MAYQVLARKYRPQRFADVIGQDHVTQTLLNALAQDRIAHGYIFSGHRGIGKTTIARILAMALQCRTPQGTPERPTPEPCGVCDACTEIRAGNSMDVIEIDAATNRGIDEIRELREGARYSPARDKYKIYILDEAHQITDAAFNALLKTLEEPPAHVIFMMATTQPEDIPQTIRSRSQHFSFHAVRFQEIVAQLRSIAAMESVGVDEAALSLLAEAGDGSMRDALSIMDQAIASAPLVNGAHTLEASQIRSLMGTVSNQVFENMMEAVKEQNAASMLQQAAALLDAGNSPQQIARQMVRFLRNCLMARLAGTNSDLLQVSDEERSRAERVAAAFSEEDLTRFLNSMLRTFDDLGYRQEQRFHLELGLLKLVHMQRLLPLEELFRQLSLPSGGGSGAAPSRLSGTSAAPKQLESSTPRPGASSAIAKPIVTIASPRRIQATGASTQRNCRSCDRRKPPSAGNVRQLARVRRGCRFPTCPRGCRAEAAVAERTVSARNSPNPGRRSKATDSSPSRCSFNRPGHRTTRAASSGSYRPFCRSTGTAARDRPIRSPSRRGTLARGHEPGVDSRRTRNRRVHAGIRNL